MSGVPGVGLGSNTSPGPTDSPQSPQIQGRGEAMEPVPTLAAAPLGALSVALLAQQLPSLPNFNGENIDGTGRASVIGWNAWSWLRIHASGMTRPSW